MPDLKKRAQAIYQVLGREYSDARCMLDYTNPLELLVATILASQCTDKQVNKVTSSLFKKYRSPRDYADAELETLEEDIRSTGFFRNKARSLQKCCSSLIAQHDGRVPADMDSLLALGGVGRKTANCVLGNAFGIPGIVVDTHVMRLSRRMGLAMEKQADKIEKELMPLIPQKEWTRFSHVMADHGRQYCSARKPLCGECPVAHLCPKIL
ncbi:MAG: endonuclease III [Candidatus Latescibacterota bacterium]